MSLPRTPFIAEETALDTTATDLSARLQQVAEDAYDMLLEGDAQQREVLTLSELVKPQGLGTAACPTIGSANHRMGTCKPCAFSHTKGCQNGESCAFCHLCTPAEKKKRRQRQKFQVERDSMSTVGEVATPARSTVSGSPSVTPTKTPTRPLALDPRFLPVVSPLASATLQIPMYRQHEQEEPRVSSSPYQHRDAASAHRPGLVSSPAAKSTASAPSVGASPVKSPASTPGGKQLNSENESRGLSFCMRCWANGQECSTCQAKAAAASEKETPTTACSTTPASKPKRTETQEVQKTLAESPHALGSPKDELVVRNTFFGYSELKDSEAPRRSLSVPAEFRPVSVQARKAEAIAPVTLQIDGYQATVNSTFAAPSPFKGSHTTPASASYNMCPTGDASQRVPPQMPMFPGSAYSDPYMMNQSPFFPSMYQWAPEPAAAPFPMMDLTLAAANSSPFQTLGSPGPCPPPMNSPLPLNSRAETETDADFSMQADFVKLPPMPVHHGKETSADECVKGAQRNLMVWLQGAEEKGGDKDGYRTPSEWGAENTPRGLAHAIFDLASMEASAKAEI